MGEVIVESIQIICTTVVILAIIGVFDRNRRK